MKHKNEELEALDADKVRWEDQSLGPLLSKVPERLARFSTLSDEEVARLATPLDLESLDYGRDLGFPGEYPFTRGVQPTMYRGRLWTMRQFAGFGAPEDTNARYLYLLKSGQTGLSVAFDFPTLMGYDSDAVRARGEVGMCGVAISSLRDMEVLFKDIPLDQVTTSMTINGPAAVLWAFYLAVAEKQGVPFKKVGGTIQNDVLKEFIAQHSWLVPPRPSMRIVVYMMTFASAEVPRWNPISISGYHIREAGSTAVQELAFTLANGVAYVEAGVASGLDVDDFAPRLSFFFDVHNDFFEEIAKLRAARRLWARLMKERFGAKKAESWRLRTHCQTAGVSLTAQQPTNNVVRVALQALAAVLGGTQSLHTNSLDETFALPTEEAVTVALRTQQIIAHESGVASTIDPLGGSYFVESLTSRMEGQARQYLDKIDAMGGMVAAVESGYPQREVARSSYRFQQQVESKEKIIVGLNEFVQEENQPIPLLKIDEKVERQQSEQLARLRRERDNDRVKTALAALRAACEAPPVPGKSTIMPALLDAVRAYATLGECCDVFRGVFGEYHDPAEF
jgi:methylmalonyl-CoA mutase N-terminal domain/subunit